MQEIIGGRIAPIDITIIPVVRGTTRSPLLAPFIHEGTVTAALHVPVPAQLFEVFAGRLRATHAGTEGRPQVTEALAGMPVCLAPESRKGHPREILRLLRFVTHAGEHHRRQSVLAIAAVVVILPTLTLQLMFAVVGLVFAVGDGATIDIVAKEIGGACNGRIDLGIDHPRFPAEHDGKLGDESRRVHRPVPAHQTMGIALLPAAGGRDA